MKLHSKLQNKLVLTMEPTAQQPCEKQAPKKAQVLKI